GSFITSFLFILLVVALMVLNELPFFQNLGAFVRVVLYSLCLGSFWAINFSLVLGFIGWVPFALALLMSAGICLAIYKILLKRVPLPQQPQTFERNPFKRLTALQKGFLIPSLGTYV